MNRDLMHQKLMKLGFSKIEAKVFVQLTTEGSQSSRDIAKALNLNICQISNILKKMQNKGFIKVDKKYQIPLLAVPFQKVLNLLIRDNIEQAKYVKKNKNELLSSWRSIINGDFTDS